MLGAEYGMFVLKKSRVGGVAYIVVILKGSFSVCRCILSRGTMRLLQEMKFVLWFTDTESYQYFTR